MSNKSKAIRADHPNLRDKTEDEVKKVPAPTNVNHAIEAITAQINN